MNEIENKTENTRHLTIYFTDFVKGLKKFWWLCVALAVALGVFRLVDGYRNYVPKYTSSATFTISTQSDSSSFNGISVYSFYYDASTASQLSTTFPHILSSWILQDAICNELELTSLPVTLSASSVSNSNLFTMSATGTDPQLTYDVLMSAIDNYPNAAKYVVGNIKFEMIEAPEVANSPTNKSNYVENALEGVVLGVILGLFFVLIYTLMRKTIRTTADIKNELNLTSLGTVPRVSFKKYIAENERQILFTNNRIGSEFTEAYRILRNMVAKNLEETDKVVVVTSTAPGEGKTTTAVNLALSLVSLGKRVLIADTDVRHPSILAALGIDAESCKEDFFEIDNGFSLLKAENYGLDIVIPSVNSASRKYYIDGSMAGALFLSMKDDYDYIIVDTPPCGLMSDTMYVVQQADAVIYVVSQDIVRISKIRSGVDNIHSTDTKIIGCVLNGVSGGGFGYGYGYGYHSYGYGYRYGYGGYGYGKENEKKHKLFRKEHKAESNTKT